MSKFRRWIDQQEPGAWAKFDDENEGYVVFTRTRAGHVRGLLWTDLAPATDILSDGEKGEGQ
jgi:hypothetical protein